VNHPFRQEPAAGLVPVIAARRLPRVPQSSADSCTVTRQHRAHQGPWSRCGNPLPGAGAQGCRGRL